MSEQDATTTFLVCFNGQESHEHGRTGVQICLGVSPPNPLGKRTGPYFFNVNLSNVRVQLPNPLPGTQPVIGTANITETLPLSAADIQNLQQWLQEYAPPHRREE